ncbi:MAG: AraC family transcriptional regulator [Ginsengibacter sp.]
MTDDLFLLSEFKKTLRRNAKSNFVDFDTQFRHKFDFYIERFEDVLENTNRTIPPNRWSYHRIVLIKEGHGDFITGIYKFRANKNTLVVIPSSVITSSKNWTTDMKGFVMLFNINFFLQNNFPPRYIKNKNILYASVKPYIHLTSKQAKEVNDIFEAIIQEKNSNNIHKVELISLKIIELLVLSERLFDNKQHFEENLPSLNIIRNFIILLDKHFLKEHSVKFYAKLLAVHPNYLNSVVKKNTNLTVKESIQNRLLLESKYLLHSTGLSIKEISNQVGFNDPNYFTAFFKRFENKSPATYRSSFV